MEQPMISVIMSVYNERPEWLRASVESILGQTYRNIELIVILDAPDNAVLEGIIREYAASDGRIVFLRNDRNHGLVYSLNRALETARGSYIARMDADDISECDRLETELRTMEDEGLDFVSGWIRIIDEDGMPQEASDEPVRLPGLSSDSFIRYLMWDNISAHPTWLVRAETYKNVGPYHEIPRAEDYEWACRAASSGARMRNIAVPVLRYRRRGGSISVDGAYTQALVAEAVRKQYRRTRAKGGGWDEDALRRRIERIDLTQDNSRYKRARAMYRAAWEKMRKNRVSGALDIMRAFFLCPLLIRQVWNGVMMKRLERKYKETES